MNNKIKISLKAAVILIAAIVNFFGTTFGGWPSSPAGEKLDMGKFTEEPVWADEFDGSELDLSKWKDHHEPQNTATIRRGSWWHRDMASVSNGFLNIQTAYVEEGISNGSPGYYTYGMDTNGLFEQRYGYFEVRCKLPKGDGHWAAFWLLTDSMRNVDGTGIDGAEIDIFESPYYSQGLIKRDSISSAIHFDGYGEDLKSQGVGSGQYRVCRPYDTFHTYGLEWNEKEYIFYVDGTETARSSFGGASQVPQHLILSVEVDGGNGEPYSTWAGDLKNNKHLPSSFVVDYVRVYQYKNFVEE